MSKKDKKINAEISATPVLGEPWERQQLLNKYGTYNIQPTADTENPFPQISQGLPKHSIK